MGKRHGKGIMMSVVGGETIVVDAMWERDKMMNEEIS